MRYPIAILALLFCASSSLGQSIELTIDDQTTGQKTQHRAHKQRQAKGGGKDVSIEGQYFKYHADDFADVHEQSKGRYGHVLRKADGAEVQLNVDELPEIRPGAKIKLHGKSTDGKDSATTRDVDPDALTILSAPQSAAGAMTSKALIILANYSDKRDTWGDPTNIVSGLVAFFDAASYGARQFQFTVTKPLATSKASGACDWSGMGQAMDAAAAAAGYDLNSYPYRIYVFPGSPCNFAGLGYVGYGRAYINGWGYASTPGIIAHEMGHNIGLKHAGTAGCWPGCNSEYGDPLSTMGCAKCAKQFNAKQKAVLGWIPDAAIATHSPGSIVTYDIDDLDTRGGSRYAIKIPTSDPNTTYWIEWRDKANVLRILAAAPLPAGANAPNDDSLVYATMSPGDAPIFLPVAGVPVTIGGLPPPPPPPPPPGTSTALLNGGFEQPATSGYVYRPIDPTGGWSFVGNSGIQRNGSAWNAPAAAEGNQTAFLQSAGAWSGQTNGSIAQTVTLKAGSYKFQFRVARRGNQIQTLSVTLDGAQIGAAFSPSSGAWEGVSIPFTIATDGPHVFAIAAMIAAGDVTGFIDDVRIAQ